MEECSIAKGLLLKILILTKGKKKSFSNVLVTVSQHAITWERMYDCTMKLVTVGDSN